MLRGAGLEILERNYRCKLGEIDLVCQDGDTLVFVGGSLSQPAPATPRRPRRSPPPSSGACCVRPSTTCSAIA